MWMVLASPPQKCPPYSSIEQDGAGARANAPPAPVLSDDVCSSVIEEEVSNIKSARNQKRALDAVKRPPVASAALSLAVGSYIASDLNIAPEYKDADLVPDAFFALDPNEREERLDEVSITQDDLDALAAEETEAGAASQTADGDSWEAALDYASDDLDVIWEGVELDMPRHLIDAVIGLTGNDAEHAGRFKADLVGLLKGADRTWRATAFDSHMAVVSDIVVKKVGQRHLADVIVGRFTAQFRQHNGGTSHG